MSLRVESRAFSVAELGEENPLPMVGAPLESPYQIASDIPLEIIEGSRFGNPANQYPYREQAGYRRDRAERELTTVVLENERVRAVFLPELGGRLWELVDKASGKQLLHSPGTIQFANLGLRNAWFAGGIEWNIGTRGHSPGTCSPLHAAIVRTPEGTEVLRMWEFDRLREVVYQIDAWLPEGSAALLAAVRLRNPNASAVPMYWWTNAAVPQSPHSRVIVPADSAFASNYDGGISRVTATDDDGIDCTWPTRNARARDFFFDLPATQRRWVLAADERGDGLAIVSTSALRGRKLFVWGTGEGGERWQRWLTPDGGNYAEIQAGLAQTQFQHLELPAGAEWSWVEAYGNAAVDPALAHGDWAAAVEHGEERVAALIGERELDAALATAATFANLEPSVGIVEGSGWGALEAARRARADLGWIDERGTPFGRATIGGEQQPWLDLLEGAPFRGSAGFVRGEDWEVLLARQPETAQALTHRAVMAHARGAVAQARELYVRAIALPPVEPAPAAIAHRGLAMFALAAGERDAGLDHYRLACELEPGSVSLLIEAAAAAIRQGVAVLALSLIARFPGDRPGRILLLEAQALALDGQNDRAAAILRAGIEVADLREGENAMAELWLRVCPGLAVPPEYQFSMNEEGPP